MVPVAPIDLFYNGVSFGTPTRTEVSIKPLPDPAGRTAVANVYTLKVHTLAAEANQALGQTADADVEALRNRLTAYGGELRANNLGIGRNLHVNRPGGGGIRDLMWGPKPQLLKLVTHGLHAVEIDWECQFAILDCEDAVFEQELLELNFSVSWALDQSGYTTRTFQGHLKIPQTRRTQADRTLSDQADAYRERVVPPALVGFRRTEQSFELSPDKCMLTFKVVDAEVGPYYPPEGVVEVSMSHEVRNGARWSGFGGQWVGTLSANYELARNVDRATAYKYFLKALLGRADRAREAPFGEGRERQQAFLISFRASHPEVYGRRGASFSASYTFLSTLADLAKASGLWASPPDSDPELWRGSLSTTAFHLRGNAKLSFAATGEGIPDVIVDLCLPGSRQQSLHAESPEAPDFTLEGEVRNPLPEPGTSWLHFQSSLTVEQLDDTPEMKLLPSQPVNLRTLSTDPPPQESYDPYTLSTGPVDEGARPAAGLGLDLARAGSLWVYGDSAAQAKSRFVTQVRDVPQVYVTLRGRALRAGYEVTPPAVAQVGGCDVTPANREGNGFGRAVVGSYFGVQVYGCVWDLRYRVLGVPEGQLAQMDHPMLGH